MAVAARPLAAPIIALDMTRCLAIAAVVLGLVAPAGKPERTGTVTLTSSAPASAPAAAAGPLGTAEPRARLFAESWDQTARREAFSPVKNQRLALDVGGGMEAFVPYAYLDGREERGRR